MTLVPGFNGFTEEESGLAIKNLSETLNLNVNCFTMGEVGSLMVMVMTVSPIESTLHIPRCFVKKLATCGFELAYVTSDDDNELASILNTFLHGSNKCP